MYQYEHHAKYYETDQMGIIHHSNYIRWMEEARIDLMDRMGFSYKAMEEIGVGSPVLSVQCEYKQMSRFDDHIVIETKVVKYNGVKIELAYHMKDKNTGELRAVGASSHCFLTKEGKLVSLRRSYPEIDEKFRRLLEEDERDNGIGPK